MNMQPVTRERGTEPVHGRIYRSVEGESLLVLGVRSGAIFVEYADGRFCRLSHREWEALQPTPAPC